MVLPQLHGSNRPMGCLCISVNNNKPEAKWSSCSNQSIRCILHTLNCNARSNASSLEDRLGDRFGVVGSSDGRPRLVDAKPTVLLVVAPRPPCLWRTAGLNCS